MAATDPMDVDNTNCVDSTSTFLFVARQTDAPWSLMV